MSSRDQAAACSRSLAPGVLNALTYFFSGIYIILYNFISAGDNQV